MGKNSRQAYAEMFGPTVGDRTGAGDHCLQVRGVFERLLGRWYSFFAVRILGSRRARLLFGFFVR